MSAPPADRLVGVNWPKYPDYAVLRTVRFVVAGDPQTQGSLTPMPGRGRAKGRIVMVSDNRKLEPWRKAVVLHARTARTRARVKTLEGPVIVSMTFFLRRPPSHYTSKGALRRSAPKWAHHAQGSDLDKLQRAIHDALKLAGIYKDDNQVVAGGPPWKLYGEPGVIVTVEEIE